MDESFLDFTEDDLGNAIEPRAAEEGEYTIALKDWKTDDNGTILQKDKNGDPYVLAMLEVIECEEAQYAKGFSHFLRIPYADMPKKDLNAAKWALRAFCECFGIDYSQRIDYEDCIGLTGEALLLVSPDTGYGEQNKVKRFLTAR